MHGRSTAAALVAMTAVAAWFVGVAKAQETARTVWDGVYSAAQAESGKHRYSGPCGNCHGRNLEGGHIFGSKTRTAPSLRGETFLSHWMGHSVGELFAQISTSMPLDHPGTLSDDVTITILAFILQQNGFPAGNRDLLADTDAMEKIQIAAEKK